MVAATRAKADFTGGRGLGPEYMHIDEAVLLIECLMQGAVAGDDALHNTSDIERVYAQVFIGSYVKPSCRAATRSMCETFGVRALQVSGRRMPRFDCLHLQYHLEYLSHLSESGWQRDLEVLSGDRPGLRLERHSAKIRQLSHARTPGSANAGQTGKGDTNDALSEEHFKECRLSISLYLYGKGGEFRLLLVGDKAALVDLNIPWPFEERHARSSLRFDPNSLGHLAGLTHFLVSMVHFWDTWYEGWRETLDKIDDIVGFEVTMIQENHPLGVRYKANIVWYTKHKCKCNF